MNGNRNDYAVIVGIDRYPALGQARAGAAVGARKFADWLVMPDGGGLPAGNVTLLAQDESDPAQDYPQLWQIHRAIANLGTAGGARVGRRLYACFAGCAIGSGADDLALLTAEAGERQESLSAALDLERHLRYLRLTGAFDELVLIADVQRIVAAVAPVPPPFPEPPTSRDRNMRELLLIGDAFIPDLMAILSEAASRDGADWRMEAAELVDRCRSRVGAGRLNISQRGAITFGTVRPDPAAMGRVSVEAWHWAVRVRVLDGLLRPLAEGGSLQPAASGRYRTEIQLPAGVYTLEATLGGTTMRQSVFLTAGAEAKVVMDQPADRETLSVEASMPQAGAVPAAGEAQAGRTPHLDLVSAAPLAKTSTAREWHTGPAIARSEKPTWPPDRPELAGESGLFVFVRTLEPERFGSFADGLSLLSEDEQTVVALAGKAIDSCPGRGWLAFNARLRPGSYILRRQSRPADAVRVRHQPIHLSPRWDTQIFLFAEHFPLLGSMVVGMVPRGAGFDPLDRAAAAAQVLLEALRAGTGNAAALAASPALLSAIQDDHEHAPWLAVLAAHGLSADGFEGGGGHHAKLRDELIENLAEQIGEHPDVRALRLVSAEPPSAPFTHPPLLRASLKLVLAHAMKWPGTVPAGSLTERVAAALVTHSPWTAWRDLEEPPARAGREALSTQLLERGFSPREPIFRVEAKPMTVEPAGEAMSADAAAEPAAAPAESVLADLPLIKAARSVIETLGAGGTPGSSVMVDLPSVDDMATAARRAHERGLVRPAAAPQGDTSGPEPAAAEPAPAATTLGVDTSPTIESCVRALRDAAASLKKPGAGAPGVDAPDLSGRLERAASTLLRHADLVAITDAAGGLKYMNGALRARIESAEDPLGRQEFEDRLRGEIAPPAAGDSLSAGPGGPEGPLAAREVTRSAITTDADDSPRGYVAVIRGRMADRLAPETLAAVDALLPRLALYAALQNSGPSPQQASYLARLQAIGAEIETLLPSIREAASAPAGGQRAADLAR